MKILIIAIALMSSTAFAQSDIFSMISDVSKLRVSTESTLNATPYRAKEHQVIKDYFVGIKEFAADIRDNSRTKNRFNNYLAGQKMSSFCSDVLFSVDDWNQIIINCTRNRFFLCAQDVLEYPEMKKVLAETLTAELLKIYKKTPECQ